MNIDNNSIELNNIVEQKTVYKAPRPMSSNISERCPCISIKMEPSEVEGNGTNCGYTNDIDFRLSDVKYEATETNCLLKCETEETTITRSLASIAEQQSADRAPKPVNSNISERDPGITIKIEPSELEGNGRNCRYTNDMEFRLGDVKNEPAEPNCLLKCEAEETTITRSLASNITDSAVDAIRCVNCSKPFVNKEEIDTHECFYLKCRNCDNRFSKKKELNYHQIVNHLKEGYNLYGCPDCNMDFQKPFFLRCHYEVEHYKLKTYKCLECHVSFYIEEDLAKHLNLVHGNPKPYQCPNCSIGFENKIHLRRHFRYHHKISVVQKCPECFKRFINPTYLQYHYETFHNRKYMCDYCRERFVTEEELNEHSKKCTAIPRRGKFRPKPHKCPTCNMGFFNKARLKYHQEEVHEKLRPYKCNDCELSYYKNCDLEYHRQAQHIKIKSNKCPDCNKCYYRPASLKHHQKMKHPKVELNKNIA